MFYLSYSKVFNNYQHNVKSKLRTTRWIKWFGTVVFEYRITTIISKGKGECLRLELLMFQLNVFDYFSLGIIYFVYSTWVTHYFRDLYNIVISAINESSLTKCRRVKRGHICFGRRFNVSILYSNNCCQSNISTS